MNNTPPHSGHPNTQRNADLKISSLGQAEPEAKLPAREHHQQQAQTEQDHAQQGLDQAQQRDKQQPNRDMFPDALELPDANGKFPDLVVEFQPVDITMDEPPGPD
ncbi:hypothetical protein KC340_g12812 [Hortaea werneckii]|nr:hypothetical protein KC342_g12508 [Hortaea werneckii]KAI7077022.1 hypothetical protein KC339_g13787 [Hortaea werneckii]KAI7219208.1 hypothetical protein KC365_g12397 [Hortaea werneckii]KAI7302251.1 hypothetical protein KC340_g12812 [Hortaea werneckii]KAI7389837.1 hypothetical protein KC328_g8245 [Hortaea werneckii]